MRPAPQLSMGLFDLERFSPMWSVWRNGGRFARF
jgi:hypothetical protein